jgi:2-hydroxy-3-oxopropionate reductase
VAAQLKIIGFIGVGMMGGPMARRLIASGHRLLVHDTNPAAVKALMKLGARAARSPREVADQAATVLASLPTPQVVREVALGSNGVIRGRAIKTFVDLSTTGTIVEKEVASALATRRIDTVDAPVSGGVAGAVKGTLAVMVAGSPRAVSRVRGALAALGKIFVVGKAPGQGQMLKLLNNLLSLTSLAVTSEAFVAGVKAGLDPDLMLTVINAGTGRNSATQEKFPRSVLPRTFDFGFPIAGACKDVGLAIGECRALGLPMLVGSAAHQLFEFAYARGGARRDMTSLITYIEPWAGVKVKGRSARAAPQKSRAR